jgi:hypothetical protein
VNHTHRTNGPARRPRASIFLLAAAAVSLLLTGCAAQSLNTVADLIEAAQDGDTPAIERLTTDSFPQEDLAILATFALEGCVWEAGEASGEKVHGTFDCPADGLLARQAFAFEFDGAKVSAVDPLHE